MKRVKQFTEKLDSLNLNTDRKTDLLFKYLNAGSKLEYEMNEYFEILPPAISKKNKGKSKAPKSRKVKNTKAKYIDNHNCDGSNPKIFDNRARATINIHLESDTLLGKKYFNN